MKKPQPGYEVGMRIRTNARYAVCFPRVKGVKKGRLGTIIGWSPHSKEGTIMVKLDDLKHPAPLQPVLFDIVWETGNE